MNKYFNKKTIVDGIKFDSQFEANRYCELKILQRVGIIKNLKLQPKFELLESFKKDGKTYRAINYKADFIYSRDGKVIVEDTKGFETEVFKIKHKLFEYKYPKYKLEIIKE